MSRKELKEFEKYFWDTIKFLEDNKFKYMLHGSTLLRIVRNNTVIPREDVQEDKELNFAMLDEDLTLDLQAKLSEFPYHWPLTDSKFPNNLTFFGPWKKEPDYESHWQMPGFALMAKFFKGKTTRIEYMGQQTCLVFPAEIIEKTGKVKFKGHTFRTPQGPKKYLDYYFGEDWKIEKKWWHWGGAECKKPYILTYQDLYMGKPLRG